MVPSSSTCAESGFHVETPQFYQNLDLVVQITIRFLRQIKYQRRSFIENLKVRLRGVFESATAANDLTGPTNLGHPFCKPLHRLGFLDLSPST